MIRSFVVVWTAIFAAIVFLATPALAEGLADPRDAAQVFVEATAAGDADAIAAIYAPNAVLLAPNAPVFSGRDAIRQVFENNFAQGENTIEFGNYQLDTSGDRAALIWNWRSQIVPTQGEPVQLLGRSLVYFVRTDEGWLISADMFQPGQ